MLSYSALTHIGVDISAMVQQKKTEQLVLAAAEGDTAKCMKLVEQGVDINSRDHERFATPLMRACAFGHSRLVKRLLEKGADPVARDNLGWDAMHWACWGAGLWRYENDETKKIFDLLIQKLKEIGTKDYRQRYNPTLKTHTGHTALMMFVKHVRFHDRIISDGKKDSSAIITGELCVTDFRLPSYAEDDFSLKLGPLADKNRQKKVKSKADKTDAANLAEKIRRQKRDVFLRLLLEWPYLAERLVQEKNEFGQNLTEFITYAPMHGWVKEGLVVAKQRVDAGEKDPDEKNDKSKAQVPTSSSQERKDKEDAQTPSATADRKKPNRGYC